MSKDSRSRMFDNIILICNKCYSPTYRGKRPYHITQCGHIFCQACQQQCTTVEKQPCPQCRRTDIISVGLEDPLPPQVTPFFHSMLEILETLQKVETFRVGQMKIVMQRFFDIDKKYEILKSRYWMQQRNLKVLTEKYMNLKKEYEKTAAALNKKLQFAEVQRETPQSRMYRVRETPDSGISFMHHSSTGMTGYSMESLKSATTPINITPIMPLSPDLKKQKYRRTVDGFRVPRQP